MKNVKYSPKLYRGKHGARRDPCVSLEGLGPPPALSARGSQWASVPIGLGLKVFFKCNGHPFLDPQEAQRKGSCSGFGV